MFYFNDVICDTLDPCFLMTLDQVRKFTSTAYSNEEIHFKKALPILCQVLKSEWKVDVVSHHIAHPEMSLTVKNLRY